jgi:hypothetical protein
LVDLPAVAYLKPISGNVMMTLARALVAVGLRAIVEDRKIPKKP